eukprot:CAMPEP_0198518180 /NCGR_PEP_ID=MMETSP1462-20131121/18968_1 /TAXON_ID=1333877 /ORGANISM="Brandtodinium nutriculum, Strain RCC3387" /LENGTH=179 /DNA_ID=CAMNT_0044247763 /DNA_START=217 /DNA_END=753 /DNA_ORIENTATION=-
MNLAIEVHESAMVRDPFHDAPVRDLLALVQLFERQWGGGRLVLHLVRRHDATACQRVNRDEVNSQLVAPRKRPLGAELAKDFAIEIDQSSMGRRSHNHRAEWALARMQGLQAEAGAGAALQQGGRLLREGTHFVSGVPRAEHLHGAAELWRDLVRTVGLGQPKGGHLQAHVDQLPDRVT